MQYCFRFQRGKKVKQVPAGKYYLFQIEAGLSDQSNDAFLLSRYLTSSQQYLENWPILNFKAISDDYDHSFVPLS